MMPIPLPKPQQWSCSRCHWQQGFVMQSDVLLPKPEKCPRCGCKQLTLQPASLLGKFKQWFR